MTRVPDPGHRYADKRLAALAKKLRRSYRQASLNLREKISAYMEQFEKEDAMMRALYDSGELSHADYMAWRFRKIAGTKQWRNMLDQMTADLVKADRIAAKMIRDELPEVYAENHNYGTYEIEHDSQMSTSYTLYNRDAVRRLLEDDPELLPQPRVDIPKDERWNRQHLQSAVTQGILSGESMKKIADRFRNVAAMDERAAMRNARTAVTGAENAGKLDSMRRAQGLGVQLKKLWLATRDQRTRDSHVLLDGELRETDEPFSNGLMYPGDPDGSPAEVYNCRCAMRSKVAGADPYSPDLSRNQRLGGMSYDEWKQEARERFYNRLFRGKETDLAVEERARLYRNNPNTVPLQALDAPGFTEKFKDITGNKKTDEAIYKSAVEILKHRNGTDNEDLILLDLDTGKEIHRNMTSKGGLGVHYDEETIQAIADAHKKGQRIVAIHNHPNGLPPTLDDGSTAIYRGYDLGVAVGHNLEVWTFGKADQAYKKNFCTAVHDALNEKILYLPQFDEDEWYNTLREYGMEVKRL